ncbi:MAG: hypothetical protein R8G66_12140 [Cytophagales bacterium]|nr:hypothetical protein [Cytophagales bacterium]
MTGDSLCQEFYLLNKDKNFSNLLDVAIGGRRGKSEYDKDLNKYEYNFYQIDLYDKGLQQFVVIPVYKKGATFSEKRSFFSQLSNEGHNVLSKKMTTDLDSVSFDAYVANVDQIYEDYYNIRTPVNYNFKNVIVEGNPSSGSFITFILRDTCKVYYVLDRNDLDERWKRRFLKMEKLGSNWYYEITKT